jgi:hypothetical protein
MGGDRALRLFCLLMGAFFHTGAGQAIQLQKNIAMAGGFLALALLGPGAWLLDGWRGRAPLARAVAEALSRSRGAERLIWAMPRPYRVGKWPHAR